MALSIGTDTAMTARAAFLGMRVSTCRSCEARQASICAGVPETSLESLASATTTHCAAPGDVILDEGGAANHAFTITSGMVKVFKLMPNGRRQIIGFMFARDILGLAHDGAYVSSAEAVTNVTLCRFPRSKLESLLDQFPQMERRLLRMTATELAAAQDQMVLLGRKTASEKIASFLMMLAERSERQGDGSDEVDLPMTRTDIADYLGLTTETVSRTVTQFRKRGCIELVNPACVRILDREALAELAEASW
jgi:CRP/FNR family transcriptional regulator, anaerobic regulatory protein